MTKRTWILGVAVATGLAVAPVVALAQTQACDQRQKVIGHLAAKYREAPIAVGVTNSGGLVEVLSTGSGDTWTIIVSSPDGTSCLIAAGEGWRIIKFDDSASDPHA